jgi:hypothetical protein
MVSLATEASSVARLIFCLKIPNFQNVPKPKPVGAQNDCLGFFSVRISSFLKLEKNG